MTKEYKTITGTVEAKAKNGKGIKLSSGENWYGAYEATTLTEVNVGDHVTLKYYITVKGPRTYYNISSVEVSKRETANEKGGVRYESLSPVYLHKSRSICRQNAVKVAVEFLDIKSRVEGSATIDELLSAALRIEQYTTGDMDYNLMMGNPAVPSEKDEDDVDLDKAMLE